MDTIPISDEMMEFIKSLSSDSRMRILLLFTSARELTVNEISERVNLGQSTTSEHLAILKRAGVLSARKENRQVFYSANQNKILTILDTLSATLRSCCE